MLLPQRLMLALAGSSSWHLCPSWAGRAQSSVSSAPLRLQPPGTWRFQGGPCAFSQWVGRNCQLSLVNETHSFTYSVIRLLCKGARNARCELNKHREEQTEGCGAAWKPDRILKTVHAHSLCNDLSTKWVSTEIQCFWYKI